MGWSVTQITRHISKDRSRAQVQPTREVSAKSGTEVGRPAQPMAGRPLTSAGKPTLHTIGFWTTCRVGQSEPGLVWDRGRPPGQDVVRPARGGPTPGRSHHNVVRPAKSGSGRPIYLRNGPGPVRTALNRTRGDKERPHPCRWEETWPPGHPMGRPASDSLDSTATWP
jgi:hypothetical protein